MSSPAIEQFLVEETGIAAPQVIRTVALLDQGATVPFIARYRKEATGELDEVQIRLLQERLIYHRELQERRASILKSIEEQGKLTADLRQRIEKTRQKQELEDLYLPYKPKRRTKAMIARERGLEPLAELLLTAAGDGASFDDLAAPFVGSEKEVGTVDDAVIGAGYILAEQFAETAAARAMVRDLTWEQGLFRSRLTPGQEGKVSKYEMYYDFAEEIRQVPSHRMLAMRRGEKEGLLRLSIDAPEAEILNRLARLLLSKKSRFYDWLLGVLEDAYRRLLGPAIEIELRLQAKKAADQEAVRVFAENLRNLLLAPPAGGRRVLGVDPGLRTGSKLAAVDETGRLLAHATIFPHAGKARVEPAREELLSLLTIHQIEMLAIGNGTASREMDQFVRQTLKGSGLELPVVIVSEAGASVYSASEIAREEFPDLDLTLRGAISIARRLQDPLAELVKVEPKSIGVGQYQHDVSQTSLKKNLDQVVESCVNYVGVDLNTASWALLSFVSGIGESLAKAIVRHRDGHGPFQLRERLLDVPRFGQKAYEQAAGFLRIRDAEQPLDNTGVHPERYPLVERMAADAGVSVQQLIADPELLSQIDLQQYVDEEVGLPTLRDISGELKKPGRDPRESFVATRFREDVMELQDLQEGMILNGVVTNVAAFGAFVDIGVHQDGLVHISQLADRFVKDPNLVVKVGQQVQVRVLSVDLQRRRIGLTMRQGEAEREGKPRKRTAVSKDRTVAQPPASDLAAALEKTGFRVRKRK